MKENILFHLPDNDEESLAALAVIDSYIIQSEQKILMAKQSDQEPVEDDVYVTGYTNLIEKYINNKVKTEIPDNTKWHLEFFFNTEDARSLASSTNKHITDAYSIMLGIMQTSVFPVNIPKLDRGKTIVLLDDNEWDGWQDLLEITETNFYRYKTVLRSAAGDVEQHIKDAAIVIGEQSFWTYVAAGMGRMVIEWFTDKNPNWLTKYENTLYRSINLWPDRKLTPTYIYRVMASGEMIQTV